MLRNLRIRRDDPATLAEPAGRERQRTGALWTTQRLGRIGGAGPTCNHPRGALPVPKYVYDFSEGNRDMKDLLGGKGANLAEMTNIGLPVPPGFVITTQACRTYLASGNAPAEMEDEISSHLATLEKAMGKTLGDADDPLLVSVRS